jgi:hypothetical protein
MKVTLFVTYMDRICTICSFHVSGIILVAQISSHYVHHTLTNQDHETDFIIIYL